MLKVDSIVAVSVIGNVPMAVGVLVSEASINGKGKCVRILHYYRDELWMLFKNIPNEGFLINEVAPLDRHEDKEECKGNEILVSKYLIEQEGNLDLKAAGLEMSEMGIREGMEVGDNDEEWYGLAFEEVGIIEEFNEINEISELITTEENKETNENFKGTRKENNEVIGSSTIISKDNLETNDENREINQIKQKMDNESIGVYQNHPFNNENKELYQEEKETIEDYNRLTPDEIIMEIFLTALLVAVKPEDFPLEPSTLQKLMHGCKNSYSLDFSKSSYKKIGKFLDHTQKLSIIEYQKPKTCDHKLIISYNKQHPMLETFVPIIRKLKNTPKQVLKVVSNYPKVIFTSCVIPKFEYKDFFSVVVPDRSHRAFQKSEANLLLTEYLKIKGLESNKTSIKTDLVLQNTLGCEEIVSKKEIFLKLKNLFEEGYLADYSSGLLSQMVYYGEVPMISITVSKGKGKYKKITVVKGFDSYLIDSDEIHELTQKTFSAAANIVKEETKMKTFYYLQVSGNHSEKFQVILNEYFKIPKSQIKVTIF